MYSNEELLEQYHETIAAIVTLELLMPTHKQEPLADEVHRVTKYEDYSELRALVLARMDKGYDVQ